MEHAQQASQKRFRDFIELHLRFLRIKKYNQYEQMEDLKNFVLFVLAHVALLVAEPHNETPSSKTECA